MPTAAPRSSQPYVISPVVLDRKTGVGIGHDYSTISALVTDSTMKLALYNGLRVVDATTSRLYKITGNYTLPDEWEYGFDDARKIFTGTGEPSSSIGYESDVYLHTSTGDFYLKGEADWVSVFDFSNQISSLITDTNWYPTAFTYTPGTASGPIGSLTGVGMSPVSFPAIPSAASDAAGIVTTDPQQFAGAKTFKALITGEAGLTIAGATTITGATTIGGGAVAICSDTNTVDIGTAATTQSINIGNNNNSGAVKTVNIGSVMGTSPLTLRYGTGGFNLKGVLSGPVVIASDATTGTFTLGGASGTGTITIGQSTSNQTVGIATGANTVGAKTLNLGTGGTTGSTAINIGSSDNTSASSLVTVNTPKFVVSKATAISLSTDASTDATLTFGGAYNNIFKIASAAAGGIVNLNTDVTTGRANVFTTITSDIRIGAPGVEVEIGYGISPTSDSSLKIYGKTTSGTASLTTNAATGKLFDDTATSIKIGSTTSTDVTIGGNHITTIVTLNGTRPLTSDNNAGVRALGGMYVAESMRVGGKISAGGFTRAGIKNYSLTATTQNINLSDGNTHYINKTNGGTLTLSIANVMSDLYNNYNGGSFIITVVNGYGSGNLNVVFDDDENVFKGLETITDVLSPSDALTYSGMVMGTSTTNCYLFGIVSPAYANLLG